ncbi:MAG: glycosyltransferase family 9 protein, partial [Planctomycetota bacterium]
WPGRLSRLGFPAGRVIAPAMDEAQHPCLAALRLGVHPVPAAADWAPAGSAGPDPRPVLVTGQGPAAPGRILLHAAREEHPQGECWPAERWSQVVAGLRIGGAAGLVCCGPEAEPVAAAVQASGLDDLPVIAEPEPAVAAAQAQGFTGFCGPNTWLAHVAAAVGCRTLVLCGRSDPRVRRPWGAEVVTPLPVAQVPDGQPAWADRCSLMGIAPIMVLAAWRRLAAAG